MRKTITAALLSAGLILGGTGVAAAVETPEPVPTGSAAGSSELLSDPGVITALVQLLMASGSAMTPSPEVG